MPGSPRCGSRACSMLMGTFAASTVIAFYGTINSVGLVAPHVYAFGGGLRG